MAHESEAQQAVDQAAQAAQEAAQQAAAEAQEAAQKQAKAAAEAAKPKKDHPFIWGIISALVAAVGFPLLQGWSIFQVDGKWGSIDASVVLAGALYAVLGAALAVLVGTAAKGGGSRARRLLSLWVSTAIGVAGAIGLISLPWFAEHGFEKHAIPAIAALVGAAIVASFYTGKLKH